MTTDKPTTILNIESLNAIGARLFEHADAITDTAADLQLAAVIASKLASLRFRLAVARRAGGARY